MPRPPLSLPDGRTVPALGLGTWMMGEDPARRADEVAALRRGLDLGLTLVDTAEMYADGEAERVVAEALAGRRDEAFVVSKVLPENATARGTIAACERSLDRLRTDRIDLYLLHWRGSVPFAETIEAFRRLREAGKILAFGVSNLDVSDCREWMAADGGSDWQTNQLLYNPGRRGIEFDLLPLLRAEGVPTMAYSPIEQGRILRDDTLRRIGLKHGVGPAPVALAWAMRDGDVIAIPKSARPDRVEENARALDLVLDADDLAAIDAAFPPPRRARPLEML